MLSLVTLLGLTDSLRTVLTRRGLDTEPHHICPGVAIALTTDQRDVVSGKSAGLPDTMTRESLRLPASMNASRSLGAHKGNVVDLRNVITFAAELKNPA